MDAQPLFLDTSLDFGKTAGIHHKLSDSVDMWPTEITQEAYKRLPYLSGYETNVIIDKMDEERGYAFGSIEINNKTDMTAGERRVYGLRKAHIPVVIKDQVLGPLDIFISEGKFRRLNEEDLRKELFRADLSDAVREKPPEQLLLNDITPPATYGRYTGSVKAASAEIKRLPLLPMLNGHVSPAHMDRLVKVANDVKVAANFSRHDGPKAALASALNLETIDVEKSAEMIFQNTRPNVVQVRKAGNGNYMVKWANTDMYAPTEEEVDPATAESLLPSKDMAGVLEADGSVTVTPDVVAKETPTAGDIKNIDEFGLWTTQDTMGNQLTGWAFPQLLSMDMQPMPLTLFTNGSQYALQDKMAGKLTSKSTDIPKGSPRGYGVLYYVDHGTAKAFVPMTVTTTYHGPDGVSYMAQTDLGEHLSFQFVDGLKTVVKMGEGQYGVPETMCWLPLKARVEVVTEPVMFTKVAALTSMAQLVGDKDVFSVRGPAIEAMGWPRDETSFLKRAEAEFLLASLGMHSGKIKEAADRASTGQVIEIGNCRKITKPHEKFAAAMSEVKKAVEEAPVKNYFLAKEASILSDALTVDKVLGLGFLNADNIAVFVEMLPGLEAASSKLAELLLAVRLGLQDIPEAALERMLGAMEDVIRGLRALSHKEYQE